MARVGFDYGGEVPAKAGSSFKQPEVGETTARVKSIIHIGHYAKVWKGKKNAPAPYVVVVFELHGNFEDDGETPIDSSISFALKSGEKSTLTKFLDAIDPKGVTTGFNDCIGLPISLNLKAGKDKNEDGAPKYVNIAGMSAVAASLLKLPQATLEEVLPPVKCPGVGHVAFKDLTKEAILELNAYLHVAGILEKSESFKGSAAEAVLAAIRKEDPEYGKTDKTDEEQSPTPDAPQPPDMDDAQEF